MSETKPVAIVTGATGNLGRAVSLRLIEDGFEIIGVGGSASPAKPVSETSYAYIQGDATDAASMAQVAATVLQRFGRIDALVHTVGGFAMGPAVYETSDADLDKMMGMNVKSVLATAHAMTPPMIAAGRGKIVFVSALAAGHGVARMGAYVAAKSAVARLTEAMSDEVRQQGINVNCIMPSAMATPQNRATMGQASMVPLEDVADVCAFLVSDRARALHGAAIPVRGLT
ncbi:MAG: hypothetical protein BGP04_11235 [Rhizobiales bacterium 62-17]|nr:SDR family NAD(P)-dependent oxidoreductase [Hyphomicrobiales bacterium]OJY05892.1 MAG: hypothetical protein BGP04_11235 [Rhizobiales bacterium 62-17]